MQISELPASNSFSGSDVIALEINGVTYKLTGATLATALQTLGSYATKSGGAVPASQGGTGKTSLNAAANALINSLTTGNSTPEDADYFITQYVGGGTSNTDYYRRPVSKIWDYIGGKASSVRSVYVGSSTYINSVNGGYIKIGRLVVFSVGYTMKASVSTSVSSAITGLPSPLNAARFMVYDSASTSDYSTPRFANIDSGALSIKGAYTANTTYYVSGAYISAS